MEGPHWAEWVALVSGALLLPLEIRELMRGITLVRSAMLIGNLAVVLYMLYVIRDNRRERRAAAMRDSELKPAPEAGFELNCSGICAAFGP